MDAFTAGRRLVPGPPGAPRRCPACGDGDLFILTIARRSGHQGDAVYCAGAYDHQRRRYLRRGCGYAGAQPAGDRKVDEA
jgi:hypothetical protein